jgi:hypothetical protein
MLGGSRCRYGFECRCWAVVGGGLRHRLLLPSGPLCCGHRRLGQHGSSHGGRSRHGADQCGARRKRQPRAPAVDGRVLKPTRIEGRNRGLRRADRRYRRPGRPRLRRCKRGEGLAVCLVARCYKGRPLGGARRSIDRVLFACSNRFCQFRELFELTTHLIARRYRFLAANVPERMAW